jgi:hypothetical protein
MSKKDMGATVSTHKYLKMLIKQKDKQRKIEAKALALALKVQSTETERRLEGLNQLREDVVKDRSLFIRQEVYYAHIEADKKMDDDTKRRLTIVETRSITWTAAIAMFLIIVEILLKVIKW